MIDSAKRSLEGEISLHLDDCLHESMVSMYGEMEDIRTGAERKIFEND